MSGRSYGCPPTDGPERARQPFAGGLAARRAYAPKELPQPQVDFAFGLLNTNPFDIRFVS